MMALEWTDVDLTKRQLCIQRSDWKGHVTMPKGWPVALCADGPASRGSAQGASASPRAPRADAGRRASLTLKIVQDWARRSARRAGLAKQGVHILRHTFCSHLAMRGAPARAIQELAGHADLGTTQRYMHLSSAAISRRFGCSTGRQPGWGVATVWRPRQEQASNHCLSRGEAYVFTAKM